MSKSHFEFEGIFDRATPQRVSVTIDHDTNEVVMRAHNDRVVYRSSLQIMARSEVQRQSKIKAMEGQKPKKLRVNRGFLRP